MSDDLTITLVGDHRDIPLALGLITIGWNSCEVSLRDLLRDLASGASWTHFRTVEPLITELGAVGISQALGCYVDEFSDDGADIADAVAYICSFYDNARAHRNYYIHGIDAVTKYGIFTEGADWEAPVTDAMRVGPFAKITNRTAKHKRKFSYDFVTAERLVNVANRLNEFNAYIYAVHVAFTRYAKGDDYRNVSPLLPKPPLLGNLVKPDWHHLEHRLPRSLTPERLRRIRALADAGADTDEQSE